MQSSEPVVQAQPELAHDLGQLTGYVHETDRRIAAAQEHFQRARDQRQLAEAPEWVDGPHTPEQVQAARDAEWAAEIELFKLADRRAGLVSEIDQSKAQRAHASAITHDAPVMRARTARPRERRASRSVRRCSSSGDDPSSDSDGDPEPALGGRQAPVRTTTRKGVAR